MEQAEAAHEFTFEELCEIVAPIAAKHGIIRVYLFGSRARGDNTMDSDYDFCVLAPKGYGLIKIGSFLYDLKDALGTGVDIISEEGVRNESFKEELLRERKIVFEA
ncbi:MAG: nucleotidyltransferase domain-containing protein [Methanomassiliicoccaceae archaeon]|nr:nucleotidyltransferase domain-containing protein [Methanomassiliicoccaceae archaeon]MCL2145581.1 nucleotidyltransferase domain-containing protein [Methanomassiliicoccaceae archaeon]